MIARLIPVTDFPPSIAEQEHPPYRRQLGAASLSLAFTLSVSLCWETVRPVQLLGAFRVVTLGTAAQSSPICPIQAMRENEKPNRRTRIYLAIALRDEDIDRGGQIDLGHISSQQDLQR